MLSVRIAAWLSVSRLPLAGRQQLLLHRIDQSVVAWASETEELFHELPDRVAICNENLGIAYDPPLSLRLATYFRSDRLASGHRVLDTDRAGDRR